MLDNLVDSTDTDRGVVLAALDIFNCSHCCVVLNSDAKIRLFFYIETCFQKGEVRTKR